MIFNLPKVKSFRNNYRSNFDNQINQNNNVTLNDCFCYNQHTEIFTEYNCNICHQSYDSEFTSRIYSSPNVLILILDRGKNNEYKNKVEFTETLELTQFVIVKDSPQIIYNLYGVIAYVEQNGSNTHYIGFCKSPINNKWYKYNDSIVSPVEDVQKEIINFDTPNILFYHKI